MPASPAAILGPSSRRTRETSTKPPWARMRIPSSPTETTSPILRAAHRAESRGGDLSRVEQIEFLLAVHRPGAGRRVAAADQVVDEIDMVRPVDPRLGFAHPALIGGAAFVLGAFRSRARHDEIGGLDQRLDPEREDLVEIERAGGVVGADRHALLQDHRPFVETRGRAEDRQPGLAAPADDRPRDRGWPRDAAAAARDGTGSSRVSGWRRIRAARTAGHRP